jgi:outer membrane protein OmpA-like peptidoglycan-associated protein
MEATGLGETRPTINCYCETCTEEEHQENRRTTFKIVAF